MELPVTDENSNEDNAAISETKEESYERLVGLLVARCHNGHVKSCESLYDMLLMNA
jgi:hypothetical protein